MPGNIINNNLSLTYFKELSMNKILGISFITLLLSACAHHRDVRPADDGIHNVSFKTERKGDGSRNAMGQAEHFCKQQNKYAVMVDENSKYIGGMKEDSYNTAKTVSKAGEAIGGAAYVFGGKRESNAGGILGLGSGIADTAIGKGYAFTMKFKCK